MMIQSRPNNIFTLFSEPYLDTYNQCYKNIITINVFPNGPLGQYVKMIQTSKLSPFKQTSVCNMSRNCILAIQPVYNYLNVNNYNNNCINNKCSQLMVVDETPELISFLLSNGYTVNTSITKMFNQSDIRFNNDISKKLICFATYNP